MNRPVVEWSARGGLAVRSSVLGLAYLIAAVLGILLTREADNVAALWPPNALLLGVMLRTERRDWPAFVFACALANVIANAVSGTAILISLGFAACNMLEVFAAALPLRYLHPSPWKTLGVRRFFWFVACAGLVAPALGATIGALLVSTSYGAGFSDVWGVWWIADAIGFLVLAPLVIVASRESLTDLMGRRGGEAVALFSVLTITTAVVFSRPHLPIVYLVSPLLLWAAFRLNLLGTAIAGVTVSAIALSMTVYGMGPISQISHGGMAQRVEFLQLFLGVAVLAPLVTAVLLSAMRDTERALHSEKKRAEVTLLSIGDAVITTDAEGRVRFMNPIAQTLTGWSDSAAEGQRIESVFNILNESDREPVLSPVARCIANGAIVGLGEHTILVGRDGKEYHIQDSAAPIWAEDGALDGVVLVFSDITERHRLAREASHHASHDALTGLVNRREFENRLERVLRSAHHDKTSHALIYMDLDQFKVVNDTKGHGAGDELLRQLSAELERNIRQRDTFARLGGDEFGLLMEHCTLKQAERIAAKLLKVITDYRFVWEGQPFHIGASMGLVTVDDTSPTIAELLRRADAACYAAKDLGRNQVHLYRDDDLQLAERHGEMQWVGRIQRALEEQRFQLHCQLIAPLALSPPESEAIRCELLLRLEDEQGEIVPPGAFLPAAERYNLANQIDQWVVRNALEWLAAHGSVVKRLAHCAINLSGQSLAAPGMGAFIEGEFKRTGVDPSRICFEVTETAAIANLVAATRLFAQLKALGCTFALDDFGAGLSSFAYLKTLPVDYLKIDGVFVKDIDEDPVDFAMVKSINELGHVTGKITIAEFAENTAIIDKLRNLGVDYAQGYGVGYPQPLATLVEDNVVTLRSGEVAR